MLKRAIFTILLLAPLLFHGGTSSASHSTHNRPALIIGIFRADGVIVPFAKYAHRKWTNPWPNPYRDQSPDERNTIADLSRPWYLSRLTTSRTWQLLLPSSPAQIVRTSQNVRVCSHCQKVWGLLTNYPNPEQHDENECVANLGIALNRKKAAAAMTLLKSDSPDWKRVTSFIEPRFAQAEKVGLSKVVSPLYLAQMPSPEKRTKTPLSIVSLSRAQLSDDGGVIFYFEASKEYSKPPNVNDPSCNNISLLDGWILQDRRGRLTLLATDYWPTDCDWDKGGYIRPFAIIRLDGRTFAIVQENGYEGESYTILEIRPHGMRRVLETYAGSC